MSLYKRWWVAVVLAMGVFFIGGVAVSTSVARDYFQAQLREKNADAAQALALTLSQVGGDPVQVELVIAAQFDTGHYRSIRLLGPDGRVLQDKRMPEQAVSTVPGWAADFVALEVPEGTAFVSDGWRQYGTLHLSSHTVQAEAALWRTIQQIFWVFSGLALLIGGVGTLIVRALLRSLEEVIRQVEAVGYRRFAILPEPRNTELAGLVRAVNTTSEQLRVLFAAEREELERVESRAQHDPLTGLANHEFFMDQLDSLLASDEEGHRHSLFMVRVSNVTDLNRGMGWDRTDAVLLAVAETLREVNNAVRDFYSDSFLGRLNGSDFAWVLTESDDIETVCSELTRRLKEAALGASADGHVVIPHAGCRFSGRDSRGEILVRLDGQLAAAEATEETGCVLFEDDQADSSGFASAAEWQEGLSEALADEGVSARLYPFLTGSGKLLHFEATMGLRLRGEVRPAGYFLPWARRLGLLPELDVELVKYVLGHCMEESARIAVNLSAATLNSPKHLFEILRLLRERPELAGNLAFEVTEKALTRNREVFSNFCREAKSLDTQLGVDSVGEALSSIGTVHEYGLDYIKLDRAYTHGIRQKPQNRRFLERLVPLYHALGIQVIAQNVMDRGDIEVLEKLGIDAMSGAAFAQSRRAGTEEKG